MGLVSRGADADGVGGDGTAVFGEDDAAFDDVLEFAHVAWPLVRDQPAHGFIGHAGDGLAVFAVVPLDKLFD